MYSVHCAGLLLDQCGKCHLQMHVILFCSCCYATFWEPRERKRKRNEICVILIGLGMFPNCSVSAVCSLLSILFTSLFFHRRTCDVVFSLKFFQKDENLIAKRFHRVIEILVEWKPQFVRVVNLWMTQIQTFLWICVCGQYKFRYIYLYMWSSQNKLEIHHKSITRSLEHT